MAEQEKAPEKRAATKEPIKKSKAIKTNKKPTNIKKIVLIVLGVIAGLIVLLIVVAMLATSGARKASDSFINHIQTKNSAAGYEELSKGAKTTVTQDQFKQVVDQIGPVLNGKPSNEGTETNNENGKSTAKVTYTIKGSDGNTYKIIVSLVKEDGKWKVEIFDSKKQ